MKHRKTHAVIEPSEASSAKRCRDKVRQALVSFFIILNIAAVLYMNLPPSFGETFGRVIEEKVSWPIISRAYYCGWLIRQYAHIVGLDNRWTMFAHNSRFNWWYVVKAEYADSTVVVLPMPGQSPPSFWQRNLFDFREAKLDLNLYPSILARKAYSLYLRRQYPTHGDSPLTSITWELQYQNILDPMEAASRGSHLEPTMTRLLNRFEYTPKGELL